jgi:SAM-dependent methyltransferase
MLASVHNRAVYSTNAALYATSHWRSDEENAVKFLNRGHLLIGGVGGGRTVGPLLADGFIVTALDISEAMVRATRQRYPDLAVVCADIQRTPFHGDLFDSIFLPWHMIGLVDDLEQTLVEMHRLLKPGGTLVFSMVNTWYLRNGPPIPKRRKQLIDRHKRITADYLLARYGSMLNVRKFRRVFSFVTVQARVCLQDSSRFGWKQRLLRLLPFFDSSLYFFCKKEQRANT